MRCCGDRTPAMKCRGFVGKFYNDEEELSYYGKVFLPKNNEEERAEANAISREAVDELRQRVKNSEAVEKEMVPKFILALCVIFIIIFIWCLF